MWALFHEPNVYWESYSKYYNGLYEKFYGIRAAENISKVARRFNGGFIKKIFQELNLFMK